MPTPLRILIVKTSSLGDVIHALPVASDIARARPGARIDWVVEESFADIPPLHPAVGTIVRTALRRWRKAPFSAATRGELKAFRQAVSAQPYDLVIDLQGLIKSAWISRHAIGPRAGFDRASAREGLASLAYQHKFAVARQQHAVLRNRQLAAAALGYSLDDLPLDYGLGQTPCETPEQGASRSSHHESLRPADGDSLWSPHRDSLWSQKIQADAAFALLITATSRDDKLWPESDWIGLGQALRARGMRAVLPAGSALERQRAERIAAGIPDAVVLPPSGIAALAESFAGAALAIGVDTGLTHLACAQGIPTLAIYTATDPGLTGVIGSGFYRNLGGKAASPALANVLSAAEQALA